MDTPLPSERVLQWNTGAGLLRKAVADLGIGEDTPAYSGMIASAEMAEKCARELQASLEAMQKEGGE